MEIICPIQGPKTFTACDESELAPLLEHLRRNESGAGTFPRGTVCDDGRLDACKQNLGPGNCRVLLDALRENLHISSLLLGTNAIGDAGATDVARAISQSNANLHTVYLGCNTIGADGVAALASALQTNTRVRGLWLKRNPIGVQGALVLAAMLRQNQTLRTLDLVNTDIGADGLRAICDALGSDNRTLQRLYLGGNGFSSNDAAPLAQLLRENPTLQALLLNVNNFGDDGAQTLADALRQNTTLGELGLASNALSSRGISALCQALQTHPTLTHLDFGRSRSTRVLGAQPNTINEESARALSEILRHSPSLRRLDVRGTSLSLQSRELLVEGACHSATLCDLQWNARPDARLQPVLERNRAQHGYAAPSPDVAPIRSVYR